MGTKASTNYWIYVGLSFSMYLSVSILLLLRSHYYFVISRSPSIVQIGHWANFVEVISTLTIIYYTDLGLPSIPPVLWGLESSMNLSHWLVVSCYLVRAYRLYLVFSLDSTKDDGSSKFFLKKNRVTQRWGILVLFYSFLPPFIICFGIFALMILRDNGLGIFNNLGERSIILFMVDTFIAFFWQLLMILMMNLIRSVINEYQMLKEMIIVTILLFINPLFSIFVHVLNREWMFANVLRNILLMIISSAFPVFMSYFQKGSIEMVTMDMLGSLELVLQNQISLDSFEAFLKGFQGGNGNCYLELYLSCECCLAVRTQELVLEIQRKVLENHIEVFDGHSSINYFEGSSDDIRRLLEHCKDVLETDYFTRFKKSAEFERLRGFLYRQEILNNRLSHTSFLPRVNTMKRTMVSLINLYDNE